MSGADHSTLKLWRTPVLVWLALMLLLGLTVGSAYVPLGVFNGVINYTVAITKAGLVLFFFMHLDRSRAAIRLVACVGVFWLLFMFSISFSDYLTRNWNGGGTAMSAKPATSQELQRIRKERLPSDRRSPDRSPIPEVPSPIPTRP